MASTSSTMPDDGAGFLSELDSSIKRFPYKNRQQCMSILDEEFNRSKGSPATIIEWILFTGVNEKTFNRDFWEDETDGHSGNWTSYDNRNHFLLFKMPVSRQHAAAAAQFDKLLDKAIEPMGLVKKLRTLPNATAEGENGKKQADGEWVPRRLPPSRSEDWPSVVLEIAFPETESKLMSDVRFWFHESHGDVKIVLMLKIQHHRPEIIFEKWTINNGRRERQQQVIVSMGTSQKITVKNAPLVIEFEKLFLRAPTVPRETDLQIDTESLKEYAMWIWMEHGFVEKTDELEGIDT